MLKIRRLTQQCGHLFFFFDKKQTDIDKRETETRNNQVIFSSLDIQTLYLNKYYSALKNIQISAMQFRLHNKNIRTQMPNFETYKHILANPRIWFPPCYTPENCKCHTDQQYNKWEIRNLFKNRHTYSLLSSAFPFSAQQVVEIFKNID